MSAVAMILTAMLGAGVFVRMVANAKHRRERYLQLCLEEKMRRLKELKELERTGHVSSAAELEV